MKILVYILLALGVICLGYNYFELQPLLKSEWIPTMLKSDYRTQSDITGLAGTILLGIGGIIAFVANKKSEGKLFLALGVLGLVLALLCFLVAFGRVI